MLRVEGLTKTFDPPSGLYRLLVRTAHDKPVHALRGVDFEVAPGAVVGLVGPNGAGKSTLIRICTTLLTATSGRVLVNGRDIAAEPDQARARIGLQLPEERAFYWRLTGRENLRFFGVMAGLGRSEATTRADRLLREFDLERDDRRMFGYSSGMRVRLAVARALIADPSLLILDEPSRSLDPVATDHLHEQLRAVADRGTAVLLSSHRLDEVDTLCDHVLVLLRGEQRAWASTAELRRTDGSAAAALRSLLDTDRGADRRERDPVDEVDP